VPRTHRKAFAELEARSDYLALAGVGVIAESENDPDGYAQLEEESIPCWGYVS
jgi:hypothetical protein